MKLGSLLQPDVPASLADWTYAGLRVLTGAFLVYGTWDNITSQERMLEFVQFMSAFGFPRPDLLAPFSVWVQFICGGLLILGLVTRWAGLLVCINFVVAVVMVHWSEDFRGWWPAIILVFLGAHFFVVGSGRFGLDRLAWRRESHGE